MAQSFLGLDIGSHTIKVAEVAAGKEGLQLQAFGMAPTPQEAYSRGQVTDAQALGEAIKALLSSRGIKTRKTISSVAGQTSLVIRIVDIPRMADSELKEAMRYEIERHIPFAASNVIMDFQKLERPGEDPNSPNMEVLFAVAQEEMIQSHVEALQAAGLEPQAIDIEPLCVSRPFLNVPGGPTGEGETLALINIGAATTEISIVKDGILHFPRSIPIGGDALTRAISEGLNKPQAEAEQLKCRYASVLRAEYTGGASLAPEPEAVEPPVSPPVGMFGPGGTLDQADAEAMFSLGDTAVGEDYAGPVFSLGEEEVTGAEFDLSGGAEAAGPVFHLPELEETPGATGIGGPVFDLSGGGGQKEEEPGGPVFDLSAGEAEEEGPSVFGASAGPVFDLSAGEAAGPAFDLSEAVEEETGTDVTFDLTGESTGDLETGTAAIGPAVGFAPSEPTDSTAALRREIYDCIVPVLGEIVTEIRRSLEYYRNRHEEATIDRIILIGGTSRLENLDRFLQDELGVTVERGDPLLNLTIADSSVSDEELYEAAPVLPISLGLAMRELVA